MQRKFLTYCLLFFIPVLMGYIAIEYVTNNIPSTYLVNQNFIQKESENIETLILGSSHLMNAVNAEWIQSPTLNLASGNQHHDTDYKLYSGMNNKLPSLKNVVLEVSYSHFEIPTNGKDFWKNSLYYKYYGVNCFERTAYFKDKLVYLSNPKFFSERIEEYYIKKKNIPKFNKYAFNYNDLYGQFEKKGFKKTSIDSIQNFRINTEPNVNLFRKNVSLFFVLLDTLEKGNKNIVITTTPVYSTYLKKRNPKILKRRDSIFKVIQNKFPEIKFLNAEADTLNFKLNNYWNHSHLNPSGAKIFTKKLDSILTTFK